MASIALSIIAKNEESSIASCIASVIPQVSAVYILDTGSTDKTVEIARSMGAQVSEVGDKFVHIVTSKEANWVKKYLGPHSLLKEGDKLFQFGEARNYALSLIPREYEYILWLDADDTFDGKQNLQAMVKSLQDNNAQVMFLQYLYHCDFNPDGSVRNVIIQHLRERLFKNDGTFRWEGNIHETLVDQKGNKKLSSDQAVVIHHITPEDMNASIQRNIKNLEYEVYRTKANDPRPIYYLAKAYFDLDKTEYTLEADRLKKAYLAGSGWPEERAQAWEYRSWIRQRLNDFKGAVKAAMNAFIEDPHNPSLFVTLARTYLMAGDFEKALFWIRLSAHVPQPETTLIMNPKTLMLHTLEVIYVSSLRTNKLDEAWAAAQKLKELVPDDPNIDKEWQFVNSMRQSKQMTVAAMEMANYLKNTNQPEKLKLYLNGLPDEIRSNQIITSFANQVFPPRKHGEKEITIFCGPGFEIWNPQTIEEKGSGGSEEAVYRLSKEFAKLGYKVTVYADPGTQRGEHDGVTYLNYYELNWQDEFNIFISWRRADVMDVEIKAKKHYLWLHDIPQVREFTPQRLERIDKVIVLSDYHASLLKPFTTDGKRFGVPAEKIMVSSNGVSV